MTIIGTGYVGLTTGCCLSALGHKVICIDIDREKIDALCGGHVPIVEEGLETILRDGIHSGRLSFTDDLAQGVSESEVVFLCLPTPQADDGSADLSAILGVLPSLQENLRTNAVLVNKSTVPVGTALMFSALLGREDVAVVSNPEFLRQGTAVRDFMRPSRVVIGGEDQRAVEIVADLYEGIDAPILRMKTASAETLKYAANAFLATKLTFINAVADICEAVGADIFDVASGIGLDPRIGSDMLRAGPGWGGSCFPKDTRALVSIAAQGGYDFALLRGVIETNDSHYQRIADKVIAACGGSVRGRVVGAWGITFKAGTDDLRDSPAIKILKVLHEKGAVLRAHDPTARGAYRDHPWLYVVDTALDAATGADVLVVLTEWLEYREIEPSVVASLIKSRQIVDARNHLDRDAWQSQGFSYVGVGR